MKTKSAVLVGILVLLVFTVGAASAETFYLTNTSEKIDGQSILGICVKVEFNGTHISVEDVSTRLEGESDVNLQAIKVCIEDDDIKSVSDASGLTSQWTHSYDSAASTSEFGDFVTVCQHDKKEKNQKTRGPIIIELNSYFAQLPNNELNNSMVVHLQFGTGEIEVTEGENIGSSWLTTGLQIPEFPTLALPVAVIMGIMFIIGRRKKE
ncbi:MAG: PEF-CTERM sorting domain-containing protein [Methanosarcinaceae archaeon]|uniref:PEF-CTERM sorting domain-containing protein n=1 Tax=Methanosarcina sp. MTP4 TaxID=1434100 RepID=UPI00064E36FD|nr:PEF-CTERM sorting domain-containing protein [Methanosarcina sp. MTP4]